MEQLIAKAQEVYATRKPPPSHVLAAHSVDPGPFTEWKTQALNLLTNLLGAEHVYVQNFEKEVKGPRPSSTVLAGQGILRAVKQDLEGGYLTDVRTLVSAEVFTDFLEMAEHLFENGFKDPAASLVGAVLEDGLRTISTTRGLKLKSREDLSSLNQKLAAANVYTRLTQKKIQVWTDVRNNADHGKFEEYSPDDVLDMIRGVQTFLAEHL